MIELNSLCKKALRIAETRGKNSGNISVATDKMLKHAATEVIEAMEAYTNWQVLDEEVMKEFFAGELADVICCIMIIAAKENIDLEEAIENTMDKNERRAKKIGDKL